MPRKPRIDVAGQLYHVLARGNERRTIFQKAADYKDFLSRLKAAMLKTDGRCLAWCLMPNHFHLLLLRGRGTLSDLMRSMMTGYAVNFNLRYQRSGHLFQNRYKAVLCDADAYFLELLAYIHLNPLRAGLVRDFGKLEEYPWCGHGEITGSRAAGIISREYVLGHFAGTVQIAANRYKSFLEERRGRYKGGEYSVGGLVRSMEGITNALASVRRKEWEASDERILGTGEFVESILKEVGKESEPISSLDSLRKEVEKKCGVRFADVLSGSRGRRISAARALYCRLAKEAGVSGKHLMEELGMSSGGISRLAARRSVLDK